jgi:AraC-like DNA-binding protein
MKIIECKLIGEMRKMYLEAQCLEILSLLCFYKLDFQKDFKMDIHTIDKLHEAREYLIKNFKSPPSINDLSKLVGLNTFALKNGFKKIFHYPIHTWINQFRMQYAKEKLLSGNHSVVQVSEMLGYANANSFSYAYKSYFGYSPSQTK